MLALGESASIAVDEPEGTPLNRPNDLEIDRDGDIWLTDPDGKDRGSPGHISVLYVERVDADTSDGWRSIRLINEVDRLNGTFLPLSESRLYAVRCIYGPDQETDLRVYLTRDDGSFGSREIPYNLDNHRGINGMTLTEPGDIITCTDREKGGLGPSTYVLSPEDEVLKRHPLPENRSTNCTLGGPDRSTFYVADMTGSLYATEADRPVYVRFWPKRDHEDNYAGMAVIGIDPDRGDSDTGVSVEWFERAEPCLGRFYVFGHRVAAHIDRADDDTVASDREPAAEGDDATVTGDVEVVCVTAGFDSFL